MVLNLVNNHLRISMTFYVTTIDNYPIFVFSITYIHFPIHAMMHPSYLYVFSLALACFLKVKILNLTKLEKKFRFISWVFLNLKVLVSFYIFRTRFISNYFIIHVIC